MARKRNSKIILLIIILLGIIIGYQMKTIFFMNKTAFYYESGVFGQRATDSSCRMELYDAINRAGLISNPPNDIVYSLRQNYGRFEINCNTIQNEICVCTF